MHRSPPRARLTQSEGSRRCLHHRHDLGSSRARRFQLRQRSRSSAVVLITPSPTRRGLLASSHEVAQYLSMTVALDHAHRFVEAPKANRPIHSDAIKRVAVLVARVIGTR